MPHNQCPPSRRGHTWRELTVTDQLGPKLAPDMTADLKIGSPLRRCKQCGALGRVSNQGVIHVVEAP